MSKNYHYDNSIDSNKKVLLPVVGLMPAVVVDQHPANASCRANHGEVSLMHLILAQSYLTGIGPW